MPQGRPDYRLLPIDAFLKFGGGPLMKTFRMPQKAPAAFQTSSLFSQAAQNPAVVQRFQSIKPKLRQ